MQTFMNELEGLVSKKYLDDVLPQLREKAPEAVSNGLGKLRKEALERVIVRVEEATIDIFWVLKDHRLEFFSMVKELTPVDVRVSLNYDRALIIFEPGVYGTKGMGLKEYNFPCWGRDGLLIRHNLSYLKEKEFTGNDITVFEDILRVFDCLGADGIREVPGTFNLPFAVEILARVLTWGLSNPSKAVEMSPSEYRGLVACIHSKAFNFGELKSVEDAFADLFSPK